MQHEKLDLLQRAVQEIQTLSIIYNDDTSEQSTKFVVLSTDEFQRAQSLINDYSPSFANPNNPACLEIPTLRVEIVFNVAARDDITHSLRCTVHFSLPPKYPDEPAIVSVASMGNANRCERENVGKKLNEKAGEIVGSEALMELIQDAQNKAAEYLSVAYENNQSVSEANDGDDREPIQSKRCWIWVHHITDVKRCKDIVREAREKSVAGYLKSGYPGVVVIEGDSRKCHEYIHWIKGNKSRPGGFGRNWGHHVRGEMVVQNEHRGFVNVFEDVGEDLTAFAAHCRRVGVEDEFKLYILQH